MRTHEDHSRNSPAHCTNNFDQAQLLRDSPNHLKKDPLRSPALPLRSPTKLLGLHIKTIGSVRIIFAGDNEKLNKLLPQPVNGRTVSICLRHWLCEVLKSEELAADKTLLVGRKSNENVHAKKTTYASATWHHVGSVMLIFTLEEYLKHSKANSLVGFNRAYFDNCITIPLRF